MPVQIQMRRGTASQWTLTNPVLAQGEMGMETDTSKFKFGDGVNSWSSLAYAGGSGGGGGTVTSVSASVPPFLSITGSPITTTGTLSITYSGTALPVANGGTGSITATGSGSVVLATSPILVTPSLGTPSSGNFSTGTFIWPTFNQNTTGNAATATNITATSNSTLITLSALSLPYSQLSGTAPTWNQSTTGTAANVTGTVAINNGGTGQTTQSAAITALSGTQTSGYYLRSNGTNTLLAAIMKEDVPQLNQSTTGTASNITATTNSTLTALSSLSLPSTQVSGLGTMSTQSASNVTITGGTVGGSRVNPRVVSAATATSLTPSIATADVYAYTALASALTINAPTGTPLDGNKLIFRILDDSAGPYSLTWDATYTVIGTILPSSTITGKTTYIGCMYNANNTRWDVIAVATQI